MTQNLAKIIVQKQRREFGVETVIFIHPRTGYQLQISPGPNGWIVASAQGVRMENYSTDVYELLPERGEI